MPMTLTSRWTEAVYEPPAAPEPSYTLDDSWKPFPDFGEPTCSGTDLAEGVIRHINSIT
jgi:hypothetical protein